MTVARLFSILDPIINFLHAAATAASRDRNQLGFADKIPTGLERLLAHVHGAKIEMSNVWNRRQAKVGRNSPPA
jgi:hypothetical protein